MSLDRQSIEKKDFPVGQRGYDPDAVDAHLAALADEVAELKRSERRGSDTLASSASDQVRAIVEAAENSAAEIQREAKSEAKEIRAEANTEAQATREQAIEQARAYLAKVSESTTTVLQRLEAMESELNGLGDSLRTAASRLEADLQLIDSNLSEVGEVLTPRPRFEPDALPEPDSLIEPHPLTEPEALTEPSPPTQSDTEPPLYDPAPVYDPAPDFDTEPDAALEAESAGVSDSPLGDQAQAAIEHYGHSPTAADYDATELDSAPMYDPEPATPVAADDQIEDYTSGWSAQPAPGDDGAAPEDAEGARLIALNMALNGTPRDETAQYLFENYQLPDPQGLLDEVYTSVGG